ncbi:MAG: CCA tRNA nucleotidyltransferase [Pseudomonadota bacterium]
MMKPYQKALIANGAQIYEVGGTIRDRLMGRERKDLDYLIRNLPIDSLISTLKPFGKVMLVGKSFGVVKFYPHQETDKEIDIALPRKEFSTGVGHKDFKVDFDHTLKVEDDLGRRDFTVNAMAYDLENELLIDPFNGKSDIEKRLIRQVFPKAFEDDPLRMLRAIQFASRLNFKIDEATFDSIRSHAELINSVSSERIIAELTKLFRAKKPSIGIDAMYETGLLQIIFPEVAALKDIEQDKQPGEDVYDHTMRVLDAAANDDMVENRGNLNLLFAALLHDIGKKKTKRYDEQAKAIVFFGHQIVSARLAKRILQRLKATTCNVDIQLVCSIIENHMFETKSHFTDRAIRRFVSKVGQENIFLLLDFRLADNRGGKHPMSTRGVEKLRSRIREELAKKPPFGAKDLKINGHDLMKLNIQEGPIIGQIMNKLVEVVLDNPEMNEPDILIKEAQRIIDEEKG